MDDNRTPMRVSAAASRRIAATDHAALTKRRDSRAATGSGPTVPAKIRKAADLLCAPASTLDYEVLAKAVGFANARALRKALALPQSVKFLREYKRQIVDEISMANPAALQDVRDNSDNAMPRVQAVRTLEQMGERMDETTGGRHTQQAPGVVIVIETPAGSTMRTIGPQPPVIEHDETADEVVAD